MLAKCNKVRPVEAESWKSSLSANAERLRAERIISVSGKLAAGHRRAPGRPAPTPRHGIVRIGVRRRRGTRSVALWKLNETAALYSSSSAK